MEVVESGGLEDQTELGSGTGSAMHVTCVLTHSVSSHIKRGFLSYRTTVAKAMGAWKRLDMVPGLR